MQGHLNIASCTGAVSGPHCPAMGPPRGTAGAPNPSVGASGGYRSGVDACNDAQRGLVLSWTTRRLEGCGEVIRVPRRQRRLVRSGMIRWLGDGTREGAQVPGRRLPRG